MIDLMEHLDELQDAGAFADFAAQFGYEDAELVRSAIASGTLGFDDLEDFGWMSYLDEKKEQPRYHPRLMDADMLESLGFASQDVYDEIVCYLDWIDCYFNAYYDPRTWPQAYAAVYAASDPTPNAIWWYRRGRSETHQDVLDNLHRYA